MPGEEKKFYSTNGRIPENIWDCESSHGVLTCSCCTSPNAVIPWDAEDLSKTSSQQEVSRSIIS